MTMKSFITLVLVLCTQLLSVHSASETLCTDTSVNCTCDLSKYNSTNSPPLPTVECLSGAMNIYIPKCQLIKSQYNASTLALSNNTGSQCQSAEYFVNNETQVVFQDPLRMGQCGNTVTINATYVTYSNILHIYAGGPLITRSNVTANVSCSYPLSSKIQLNVTLNPVVSTTQLSVPGAIGAVTVTMAAFTDPAYSAVITDQTSLTVEQTIYFSISVPDLEADSLSIKVLRIYAGPGGTNPNSGVFFNLTTGSNGCPDPSYGTNLINMTKNGAGSEARFTMQVFQITGYDSVSIYADVTLCQGTCITTCNANSRSADISTGDNVARIGLDLSTDGNFLTGAVDRVNMPWTLFSLISSLLFVKLM
ncbi:uromodulin-like [Pseudophryne corroboree]|uniref:uromodulin-like n=1 Tax=Pseudophryne corroboree TaxID=495146 RepID=UPI003081D46A